MLPRAAAGSVASMAAEAVARLCAVVQGLGAHARQGLGGPLLPGACFCEDLREACGGLLGAAGEFVEALAAAAAAAAVDDARVADYVDVFYLLHLSGMRETAGVKSVA